MGKIMDNKFERRFGGRIYTVYPDKSLSSAKYKEAVSQLQTAFIAATNGILGRYITTEELLGITRLNPRK